MEPKGIDPWGGRVIRYTLRQDQIQDFVNGLHEMQADMIEAAVAQEEAKGFPKVKELLASIKG